MNKNLTSIVILLLITFYKTAFADPIIEVPDKEFNFGELLPGQVVHHSYVVKNVGTKDLIITDVSPGCGCTTALLVDKTVPPGKSVKIEADLTAQTSDGVIRKNINIVSNDPKNPTYIIYLNATVKSDFIVEPKLIDVGDIFIGEKKEFKFTLKPVNKKPFEPSQVIANTEIFKVEYKALDVNDPLSAIEFKVEYYAEAKYMPRQAYDLVKIYPYKNNTTLCIDVPFKASVKGYIKQSDSSIFRSVEKGKSYTEKVSFNHIKGLPFNIISAESSNPKVTTNIVKISDSEYDVEIILKDGLESKKEQVMVTVTTDQVDSKVMKIYETFILKK